MNVSNFKKRLIGVNRCFPLLETKIQFQSTQYGVSENGGHVLARKLFMTFRGGTITDTGNRSSSLINSLVCSSILWASSELSILFFLEIYSTVLPVKDIG